MQQSSRSPSFRLLPSVIALGLFSAYTQAQTVEFNSGFFAADNAVVADLSRFNQGNYIPPGEYEADVFVNGDLRGRTHLRYIDDGSSSILCLSDELDDLLDLKSAAYGSKSGGECEDTQKLFPEGTFHLDMGVLALKLEIPQALVNQRPRGYIPPSLWQDGVPAIFANYAINHYTYTSSDSKPNHNQYFYFNGGVNLFGWAVRHNGSMSRSSNGYNSGYQRGLTYVKRAVPFLQSEVTFGDVNTDGSLMNSVPLRGVVIGTDIRMLPQTQRGYAPRIQGIANTNATVIIRQNDMVIHQISVPAGPFVIDDLYPTGYSGELTVEINEADGSKRTLIVPYATLVPLMRPGQLKYQLGGGRYRSGLQVLDNKVFTGTAQYGLTNNITVNGGVIASENYRAGAFGLAWNTPIGAISGDITHATAHFLDNNDTEKGYSIRANYNLYITPTKTNITLATYRYFSRNYYTLDETIWSNNAYKEFDTQSYRYDVRDITVRPKNQYQLSVSQELGDGYGSVYFSGSTTSYWNLSGRSHNFQISYGNSYKLLSYNIGYSQSRTLGYNKTDRQLYVSFSMPLFTQNERPYERSSSGYYSGAITADNNGGRRFQNTFSQSFGEHSQYHYSVSASMENDNNRNLSANASYTGDVGNIDASMNMDNKGNRQYTASARGAVVLHQKGITLTNSVGDSFAIVHAKNGAGAKVNNGLGKKLDYFGNAIVEYVTPYEKNRISIDPSDLPVNIEFDATEKEIIPKANSAMLVNLTAHKNTMILFNLTIDGEIPMGAEALDSEGKHIGYVAQGGSLFANRLTKTKDRIKIKWGLGKYDQCYFDYNIPDLNDTDVNEMKHIDAKCVLGAKE